MLSNMEMVKNVFNFDIGRWGTSSSSACASIEIHNTADSFNSGQLDFPGIAT